MADFNLVEVLYAREELLVEFAGFFVLQSFLLDDELEELATTGILHDQEELPVGFDDLVELDDVGVPHYLQDLDLSSHSFNVCFVNDLFFLEYFDCHFLSGERVSA